MTKPIIDENTKNQINFLKYLKSVENPTQKEKGKKNKKNKLSKTVDTFFRNALKSNLELTSLADTKASILISVNGFILTVIMTASGFMLNDEKMIYPFNAIIITSLISILLGILAIRPRFKEHLFKESHSLEYSSVLYFQDMISKTPSDYIKEVKKVIKNQEDTNDNIIKHLYILSAEINLKYKWLRRAYGAFGVGLLVSAILALFSMHF